MLLGTREFIQNQDIMSVSASSKALMNVHNIKKRKFYHDTYDWVKIRFH